MQSRDERIEYMRDRLERVYRGDADTIETLHKHGYINIICGHLVCGSCAFDQDKEFHRKAGVVADAIGKEDYMLAKIAVLKLQDYIKENYADR